MNKDLKSKTANQLIELVQKYGGKKFHAKYIFSFIHTKFAKTIDDISPLSKAFRAKLVEEGFFISSLKTIEKFVDPDGTIKYLFETDQGHRFETVLLDDKGRKTLCISSQVGCKMNCSFCATANIKFKANLTAGEILDQVYKVTQDQGKISNIVYMGMGEPFDNYENVISSAYMLNSSEGLAIGSRHITISTCGIIPGIERITQEDINVRLAVSIHAGTDDVRDKLLPINKAYPLKELTRSLRAYYKVTGRRITLEYCMIKGVNDSLSMADTLAKVINGISCNINLIEYNPHPGSDCQPSSHNQIKRFQKHLEQKGFETHMRFKRGQSIKAACGQLGADWLEKQ